MTVVSALLAIAASIAAPSTESAPPLADLPFDRRGAWVVLAARFGNRPIQTILDTGAGASVIDERLARDAGFRLGRSAPFWGVGSARLTGRALDGVKLDLSWAVSDLPILFALPFDALADPSGRIDAILGGDFFGRYVVEIDPAASRVRLYEPSTYHPLEGLVELPMQIVDGAPTVDGTLHLAGMEPLKASIALDTGSQFGVDVGYRTVVREGLEARFAKQPTIESGGFGGARRSRAVGEIGGTIGPLAFAAPGRLILEATTEVRRTSTVSSGYDVTLGGEALRGFRLVLDYFHGRVYVGPSGLK